MTFSVSLRIPLPVRCLGDDLLDAIAHMGGCDHDILLLINDPLFRSYRLEF